jgi:hypothetical protein
MKTANRIITDNQYYGALNRRFDSRVRLLYRFGFRFDGVSGPMVRRRPSNPNKLDTIPRAAILGYPPRVWRDMVLTANLRRA